MSSRLLGLERFWNLSLSKSRFVTAAEVTEDYIVKEAQGFSKGSELTAELKSPEPEEETKVYIRRINALNVPLTFLSAQLKADEEALLDSGATENFIDEETWERLGVG